MRIARLFSRRGIVLIVLAAAVVTAVTYGVVTYQTPYGCDSSGVATGPGIDWQVLAKPCIYVYFTGIVGGSAFLILLIPIPEKKARLGQAPPQSFSFSDWAPCSSYSLSVPTT